MADYKQLQSNMTAAAEAATFLAATCYPDEDLSVSDPCICVLVSTEASLTWPPGPAKCPATHPCVLSSCQDLLSSFQDLRAPRALI